MQTLWQDLRYAARILMKHRGFTLIAVLTLGLGIGANTAVFSVVNAFLLRPLPYHDPERLVVIQRGSDAAEYRSVYSYPVFRDLREQSQSFESIAVFTNRRLTLDGADGPEIVFGVARRKGRSAIHFEIRHQDRDRHAPQVSQHARHCRGRAGGDLARRGRVDDE